MKFKLGLSTRIIMVLLAIFAGGFFAGVQKASAIQVCSLAGTPRVVIETEGYGTFTSTGASSFDAISVPSGTRFNFVVHTYAEPGSYNDISYPNGKSQTYPAGPSGAGRFYGDMDPVTGSTGIHVTIQQNCLPDPETGVGVDYTLNIGLAPSIINVVVSGVPSTCWTISGGPTTIPPECGSGNSYSAAAGTYSISADAIAGKTLTITPSSTQTLSGSSITFTLAYADSTSAPGAFSITGSSCFGWPSPQIEVNFNSSSGATSYDLERSVNGGGFRVIFSGNYAQMDAYSDSAVSAGNTYTYRVRAINGVGSTFSSTTAPITVGSGTCGAGAPPPPPPPPTGGCIEDASMTTVTAIPASISAGQVVPFSFTITDTGNTRWPDGGWWQVWQTSSTALSIISTGPPGVDGLNYGHYSYGMYPGDTHNWTFNLTAPSTPGNYTLVMQAVHKPGRDFLMPDGTTCPGPGSNYFYGQQFIQSFSVTGSGTIFVNSDTATSWTVTGPSTYVGSFPSTTATYANAPANPSVYAISANTRGGYVGPSYVSNSTQTLNSGGSITFTLTYLATPTNLTATSSCNRAILNWTDNANNENAVGGYQVWRSSSASGPFAKIADLPQNTQTYNDNTVLGGGTYYYNVRAISSALTASSSDVNVFIIQCAPNINNSTKVIYQVNRIAYTPSTIIHNGDIVTFRYTIINSNTATDAASITGISPDVLSDNLTHPATCPAGGTGSWCLRVDKNGNGIYGEAGETGSIGGSEPSIAINLSGNIPIGSNWVILFDAQAVVSPVTSNLFTNTGTINCTGQSYGANCSVTKRTSFLNANSSAKPPVFKEISP
ncbi:MAG: hypothetical protein KW788_00295 [Candidatus Doudnabacteria bacterium]|nr:hypothetical protein [Candidatus Doudnabacteria bacterium]